ncbi:SPOR domain-containing protein [Sabulicella rubraurantiaca]|uniref:SPOR domain-containing protein n=1 Tax=Sabulicella rubraurantiaca TaxID=2811429 RepID=UPI001A9798BA|nr:SPOR domain-containing protein [Sabulicella rubraurantiaca]
MSDAMLPSWRVRPPERTRSGLGIPSRLWMIGGGLCASVALAALIIWLVGQWGPRGVPVIEPDGRPFKVRPDSPGGIVVPNQGERIFERHSARQGENAASARLAPGPEAPRFEVLRAQQDPRPAAAPAPAVASAQPSAVTPVVASVPAPDRAAAPAATGRVMVQVAATRSEEGAKAEWDRLVRRAPELQGRSPVILRVDTGSGQPPIYRVRTGGFPDASAARSFCDSLRARNIACNVAAAG